VSHERAAVEESHGEGLLVDTADTESGGGEQVGYLGERHAVRHTRND